MEPTLQHPGASGQPGPGRFPSPCVSPTARMPRMTTAGEVPPDTKDWTWVLERPCPECGLEVGSIHPGDLPHLLRANAQVWLALMGDPDVGVRPEPHVWSPLEYACHVHDVHQLFHERVTAMLTEERPHFA